MQWSLVYLGMTLISTNIDYHRILISIYQNRQFFVMKMNQYPYFCLLYSIYEKNKK